MIDCKITANYFKELARMTDNCQISCNDCPLWDMCMDEGCIYTQMIDTEECITVVQEWSNAHSGKTFLSDFLEKYPNIKMDSDGMPKVCPHYLGYCDSDERSSNYANCDLAVTNYSYARCDFREINGNSNCTACWNRPMSVEATL